MGWLSPLSPEENLPDTPEIARALPSPAPPRMQAGPAGTGRPDKAAQLGNFTFAALMILAHFSVSLLTKAAICSGVEGVATAPSA